jgi:hypothetical protein
MTVNCDTAGKVFSTFNPANWMAKDTKPIFPTHDYLQRLQRGVVGLLEQIKMQNMYFPMVAQFATRSTSPMIALLVPASHYLSSSIKFSQLCKENSVAALFQHGGILLHKDGQSATTVSDGLYIQEHSVPISPEHRHMVTPIATAKVDPSSVISSPTKSSQILFRGLEITYHSDSDITLHAPRWFHQRILSLGQPARANFAHSLTIYDDACVA